MPTEKAIATMIYSKYKLSMILMPNKGRLLKNKGNKAQCMAQAKDVAIPNASQLILNAILEAANVHKCNVVAKYFTKHHHFG
jgi:UDP-N-acetylglucosamine:LPS N-acetylglucosamine transferase